MKTWLAYALAVLPICAATPAASAVVTTGCGGDCTLAELFAGGTIQVDDVLFDGFGPGPVSDAGVDPGAITVTGSSFAGDALLAFAFLPALSVDDGEAAEFDLEFDVGIIPGATIQIVGASLSLLGAGTIGQFSFAEVNTDVAGQLLTVDIAGAGGGDSSDDVVFAPQSSLFVETDIQVEADDPGGASLGSFLLTVALEDADPQVIPLPAGALLLLSGLAGLALLRRRTH